LLWSLGNNNKHSSVVGPIAQNKNPQKRWIRANSAKMSNMILAGFSQMKFCLKTCEKVRCSSRLKTRFRAECVVVSFESGEQEFSLRRAWNSWQSIRFSERSELGVGTPCSRLNQPLRITFLFCYLGLRWRGGVNG